MEAPGQGNVGQSRKALRAETPQGSHDSSALRREGHKSGLGLSPRSEGRSVRHDPPPARTPEEEKRAQAPLPRTHYSLVPSAAFSFPLSVRLWERTGEQEKGGPRFGSLTPRGRLLTGIWSSTTEKPSSCRDPFESYAAGQTYLMANKRHFLRICVDVVVKQWAPVLVTPLRSTPSSSLPSYFQCGPFHTHPTPLHWRSIWKRRRSHTVLSSLPPSPYTASLLSLQHNSHNSGSGNMRAKGESENSYSCMPPIHAAQMVSKRCSLPVYVPRPHQR